MVDIITTAEAGSAEERRQQIQKEYGAYVAAESITINGALAFAPGHPVPISHVEAYPALVEEDEHGNKPVVTVEEWAAMQASADDAEPSKPEPAPVAKKAAAAPPAKPEPPNTN